MKCEECGSNAVSMAGYDDDCETYECEACGATWEGDCDDDVYVYDDTVILDDSDVTDDLNGLGYPLD